MAFQQSNSQAVFIRYQVVTVMKFLMKPLLTVKGLGADLASLSIFIIFILPVLIIFILLGQEVHTHKFLFVNMYIHVYVNVCTYLQYMYMYT